MTTTSRKLSSHIVPGTMNEELCIEVLDAPGQGNACHEYAISYSDSQGSRLSQYIHFQNGPIQEYGVNGISNEALLAIVEDRLLGFQSGPYLCRENAIALTHIQDALMWLQKRTRDRLARGVEGRNER